MEAATWAAPGSFRAVAANRRGSRMAHLTRLPAEKRNDLLPLGCHRCGTLLLQPAPFAANSRKGLAEVRLEAARVAERRIEDRFHWRCPCCVENAQEVAHPVSHIRKNRSIGGNWRTFRHLAGLTPSGSLPVVRTVDSCAPV